MAMAIADSNLESKVFVSAMPYNAYKNDPSLESPLITFKCNIKMSYVSDKRVKSSPSYIPKHDSWHEFQHPVNDLTRNCLSDSFADAQIPFPLTNLHWKKHDSNKESIPLSSMDCVISSLLDACHNMTGAARDSGRKKLFLLVMIKKQVIVPHHEFWAMLKANRAQEVLSDVEDMIRLNAQGWNFRRSEWEEMDRVVRQAELGRSIRNALYLAARRSTAESGQAVVKSVPAAATSIQALEKVQSSDYNSTDKCSVCMDEMGTDHQITRMPCSHEFHEHCIGLWLKTSHMCPICRFKLPTL